MVAKDLHHLLIKKIVIQLINEKSGKNRHKHIRYPIHTTVEKASPTQHIGIDITLICFHQYYPHFCLRILPFTQKISGMGITL